MDSHGISKWTPDEPSYTYDQLNEFGNRSFRAKKYRDAVRFYDKALRLKPTAAKTLSNRSSAHFELEMFYKAFVDAQRSSKLEPSEKAYYRMGKALYAMRQFEQAVEAFRAGLALNNNNNTEILVQVERSQKRVDESKTGKYDMKSLIGQLKLDVLSMDVADFVSGDIAVKNMGKKGKGVVALKDIKRGTLLVGSKATSIAFESQKSTSVSMTLDFCSKRVNDASAAQNIKNLYFKLQNDPYMASEVSYICVTIDIQDK